MGLAISQQTGHWLLNGPPSCTSYVNLISRGATPPLQNEAGEISQNFVFRTTPWGTRVDAAPTGVMHTEVCQEEARQKSRPQKAKGMQDGLGIVKKTHVDAEAWAATLHTAETWGRRRNEGRVS